MGRIIKFRRRRAPKSLKFWPDDRNRVTFRGLVRDTIFWLRPVMLLAGIVILWPTLDPALVEPMGPLATEPEPVNNSFTLCDQSRGLTCVIDGDTFKLGGRRIRIIGIDAPETHPPRCADEAALGQAATVELQRLLNDGPFEMIGRVDEPRDRYGRELKALRRVTADGSYSSIAGQLRESGHARRYLGGFRSGWR